MPCDSDYLEPSRAERDSLAVLGFLRECGLTPTGKDYDRCYGSVRDLNGDVVRLCEFLRTRTPEWIRDNTSLELQVFWRDHQKFDRDREQAAHKRAEQARLKAAALGKLTPEERKALGLAR